MENRVSPIYVTHRVGVVAHPIFVFVEYTLVPIKPIGSGCSDYPSLSPQQVKMLGGVRSLPLVSRISCLSFDYVAGVLPHDY